MVDHDIDADAAARLLEEGEVVGAMVQEVTDYRTLALIQAGLSAAIFVYLTTYFLLLGAPNDFGETPAAFGEYPFLNVLIVGFLTLMFLVQGQRERLRIALVGRRLARRVGVNLIWMIPLVAIGLIGAFGRALPLWVTLLVAVTTAIPLAILAAISAWKVRTSAVRPLSSASRAALSVPTRTMTLGLGVYLGVTGAFAAFPLLPSASLIMLLIWFVLICLGTTRWGLPSVGSEWRQPQWVSFGVSFTLLFALTVVLALTPWNTPLVGILGGIVVATPLVIAAFRSVPDRDRS